MSTWIPSIRSAVSWKTRDGTLTAEYRHIPVLLDECIEALDLRDGVTALDCTLGGAGHSEAIARSIAPHGTLIGIDQDDMALEAARKRLDSAGLDSDPLLLKGNFADLDELLVTARVPGVDAALFDLGVSSPQFDFPERGFSYREDAPLDMRMDRDSEELPVSRLVNRAKLEDLKDIIERYGEDPQAGRIARAIVEARVRKPIETTGELAALVERAYPAAWRAKARNHPATRTFQALRMAVNDEIGELERFLDAILGRLKPGGRVAVISFHSLEDRVVKHRMKAWAQGCICPKHIPVCVCHHAPEALLVTPKPVCPSERELMLNPRAGSAKLRVAEKLDPHARQADEDSGEEAARLRYEAKRAARLARHGREGRERA